MQRATVERDFPCRRCGYNVRGLQPDGLCPECNAPVIAALYPHLIEFADPQWLKRLEAGTSGAFSAGMVLLYSAAAGMIIAWVPAPVSLIMVVFAVATVLFCFLLGRAVWNLSAPNPVVAATEPSFSNRKVFRSLVITVPCTVALASIAELHWGGPGPMIAIMLGSPIGLLGLISVWGYARYMRTLAEYSGLEFAVKRISFHLVGYTISWALLAPGFVGLIYPSGPLICLFLAGIVGVLGFGALLVFAVPDYIGVYLQQIQKAAEENWQQATDHAGESISTIEPSDLKINGANGS